MCWTLVGQVSWLVAAASKKAGSCHRPEVFEESFLNQYDTESESGSLKMFGFCWEVVVGPA